MTEIKGKAETTGVDEVSFSCTRVRVVIRLLLSTVF